MEEDKKEEILPENDIQVMIEKMRVMNEEFFTKYNISPHQLHHFINDPTRFPPAQKAALDKMSAEIEQMIDAKIQEENRNARAKSKKGCDKIGGHWLFLR
jgi:hypothetical protein